MPRVKQTRKQATHSAPKHGAQPMKRHQAKAPLRVDLPWAATEHLGNAAGVALTQNGRLLVQKLYQGMVATLTKHVAAESACRTKRTLSLEHLDTFLHQNLGVRPAGIIDELRDKIVERRLQRRKKLKKTKTGE